jgi:NitT/TauT family transport system permease protein
MRPGRAEQDRRERPSDTTPRASARAWWDRPIPLAVLGVAAFLGLWEALPRLGLANPMLVPGPSAIPRAFWAELTSGAWVAAVRASLSHYALGLAIGTFLGLTGGVVTGLSRRAEAFTSGIVRILRPIPGLAWVPFAILWFGVSPSAAVFVIAIGVFWIVFFATHGAVRAVDRDLIEVAEAFGFRSAPDRLRTVVLPAATPGILVGVRTALGQAWMAVVAAEIFGVAGLGQRMIQASSLLASEIVVVYMLTMAALYGLMDMSFVALQRWLLRWKA